MNLNKLFQDWSIRMAQKAKDAVKRRPIADMRVKLIPIVDELNNFTELKTEIQNLITMMVSNLHKRGRPKKQNDEVNSDAA